MILNTVPITNKVRSPTILLFMNQARHNKNVDLPVKQTGHLNVPPIPSKLCSIR